MMKKVLSLLFSAAVLLGLGTPAFAAEEEDVQKALEIIRKTNKEIDEEIEKAVKKADALQVAYLLDIRKIEEGDKVVKLSEEKEKILIDLEYSKNDIKKQTDLNNKLVQVREELRSEQLKVNGKVTEINQEITEVTEQLVVLEDGDTRKLEEKINKLNEKLNAKSEKSQEKTQRFTKDLEKVITDIYSETLEMSANAIEKAAKKGVKAECSWKLVRFADKWVWIDPIRVVGW